MGGKLIVFRYEQNAKTIGIKAFGGGWGIRIISFQITLYTRENKKINIIYIKRTCFKTNKTNRVNPYKRWFHWGSSDSLILKSY